MDDATAKRIADSLERIAEELRLIRELQFTQSIQVPDYPTWYYYPYITSTTVEMETN